MKSPVFAALLMLGAVAAVTAKSAKCNCNCPLSDYKPLCAVDNTGDSDTFPNECVLKCYNCTHDKAYVILRRGECSSTTTARPRSSRGKARMGRSLWHFW
ncbi:Kazal peptide Pr13a [Anabrus simplex]|uniref:Kazal peptide Pr13a n=1 Tax=Anabrus simplex TaxID=316456 RepID=UPI0034DCD654